MGSRLIQQRTNNIPIKADLSININNKIGNSLSLKENFFDPSKSSPPNEFILKLQKRINSYNNYVSLINSVNLANE
jgi:hypothetical protein